MCKTPSTVFCSAAAIGATADAPADCSVNVGANTYRIETLANHFELAFGLAVDYDTNVLYFSYYKDSFKSAKLDLITKTISAIPELPGLCIFAVNQKLGEVHAGCKYIFDVERYYGLYQFDSNVGQFEPSGEEGQEVEFVYYDDFLYYSRTPSTALRTFRRGHSSLVDDFASAVNGLVIDKKKDRIFYNRTGVYCKQPGSVRVARFSGVDIPRALAVDASGDIYACDSKGVYLLHKQTANATLILPTYFCNGLTFDGNNNMISTIYNKIMRLVKC